jgi:hypothetical protein
MAIQTTKEETAATQPFDIRISDFQIIVERVPTLRSDKRSAYSVLF